MSRLLSHNYFQQWRLLKDRLTGYSVIAGGLSVIIAIVLIFFYLLYVVLPLFLNAQAHIVTSFTMPQQQFGQTVFLATEEQNEIGVRFTDRGRAVFFSLNDGSLIKVSDSLVPPATEIASFAHGSLDTGLAAYGLADGRVVVFRHHYKVTYPNDVRLITPVISYPLGPQPILLDPTHSPITKVAVRFDGEQMSLIGKSAGNRILLTHFARQESFLGGEDTWERTDAQWQVEHDVDFLLLDKEQRNLYLANVTGSLSHLDISDKTTPEARQQINVLPEGGQITSIAFLNGELSLLIGDSRGNVGQWSVVRNSNNISSLRQLRNFVFSDQAIYAIAPEQRRKGFAVVDAAGYFGVYHSTSARQLIGRKTKSLPIAMALSPRANALLLQARDGKMNVWSIDNEHPEVSIRSLWQKVWYESYPKPEFVWQSSSASNDFEPKMSLTPLVFGTLKAALYAMVIAVPLALMGAVYTAYFMAPRLRQLVKPSIEIMEALPTVILGFLAGLWLAPFIEQHLLFIFAVILVVPVGTMCFAFFWQYAPPRLRDSIPEGWDAAMLVPVIIFLTWLAFVASPQFEIWFFGGNLRTWITTELGISYDQRNALVVGIAMGLAVIPTIFSIAEDAIFSVPKHLTTGSLALGATPWQTLSRVVLLTASPGIFSAIMIGLGRAVGETMIVLMATGNTPVMDMSIFQGMRTLSANIAVEMPESEVDSTHYRVLFLAALVLFLFTFVFNTLAELIRQNLRQKYSSL